VLMLFEATLTGDVNTALDCMRGTQRAAIGLLLLQLFMVISILLLLNMIIAIMGQTFANFYARAQERGALHFARIVQDWEDHTDLPPLFNLLALPGASVALALRPLARICCCEPTTEELTAALPTDDPLGHLKGRVSGYRALEEGADGLEGAPTIDELCAAISETIERTFGSWDSTAQLINSAVKTMLTEMHELRDRMNEQAQKLGVERRRRARPHTPVRKPTNRSIGAEDAAPPAAVTDMPILGAADVASATGAPSALAAAVSVTAGLLVAPEAAAAPIAADVKSAAAVTLAPATPAPGMSTAKANLDRPLPTVPKISMPPLQLPPRVIQKGSGITTAPVQAPPRRLPQWPPPNAQLTTDLARLPRVPLRPPPTSDHVPSVAPSSMDEDLLDDQHLYES